MDSSIAAGAALLASALTGLITYKVAAREQRGRDVEELRAALAAYGAVLDRFGRHLDQLPHPPGPAGRWVTVRSRAGGISIGRWAGSPPAPSGGPRCGPSMN